MTKMTAAAATQIVFQQPATWGLAKVLLSFSVVALCSMMWAPPSRAQAGLDYEFYRENIEPIFLRGHGENGLVPGACVMCHSWQVGTPFKLQPLQHDAGGEP